MTDLPAWPDVHEVARDVLLIAPALVASANIGTNTPASLESRLPFLRIRRIGGGDNLITDQPRVDVEVHAATASQAWDLARSVQQRFLSAPHAAAAGVLDRASTEVGPQEIPHPNTDLRLVTATYRLSLRR